MNKNPTSSMNAFKFKLFNTNIPIVIFCHKTLLKLPGALFRYIQLSQIIHVVNNLKKLCQRFFDYIPTELYQK